jgi:hypothetical protein
MRIWTTGSLEAGACAKAEKPSTAVAVITASCFFIAASFLSGSGKRAL